MNGYQLAIELEYCRGIQSQWMIRVCMDLPAA